MLLEVVLENKLPKPIAVLLLPVTLFSKLDEPNEVLEVPVVIANDDLFGLPRTPRGQQIVWKAHLQAFNSVEVEGEDV